MASAAAAAGRKKKTFTPPLKNARAPSIRTDAFPVRKRIKKACPQQGSNLRPFAYTYNLTVVRVRSFNPPVDEQSAKFCEANVITAKLCRQQMVPAPGVFGYINCKRKMPFPIRAFANMCGSLREQRAPADHAAHKRQLLKTIPPQKQIPSTPHVAPCRNHDALVRADTCALSLNVVGESSRTNYAHFFVPFNLPRRSLAGA